jgi:hypothetical protein
MNKRDFVSKRGQIYDRVLYRKNDYHREKAKTGA